MPELNDIKDEPMQVPPSVKTYNPLTDEPVIENPNVLKQFSQQQDFSNVTLGEQEFVPPPITDEKTQTVKPKEAPKPINQELNELSQKEKDKAAKMTANAVLDGYSWLWSKASVLIKISNSRVKKLEEKGLIDTSAKIPFGRDEIKIREAIRQYNEMGGNPFEVTEEFKDEVRPVLARVLAKKGIGMTDEQYLLYLFGKDIAEKLIIFKELWKQRNDYINAMIDGYKVYKEYNERIQTQQQAAPTYQTSNVQNEGIKTETKETFVQADEAAKPTVTIVKEEPIQETEIVSVETTKQGFPKRKTGRKPKEK